MTGIHDRRISETPISIIDFETTSNKKTGRVVELSVVRCEPGKKPEIVLDTMLNPEGVIGNKRYHGIYPRHVVDAPTFKDIAGDFVEAISNSVVAAYNISYDKRFLGYEFERLGIDLEPPYLCVMWMRVLLGLGERRCKLAEACSEYRITNKRSHMASSDAMATSRLLKKYLTECRKQKIRTFGELAKTKKYKFMESWTNTFLPASTELDLACGGTLLSRMDPAPTPKQVDPVETAIRSYWDTLKEALSGWTVTESDVALVAQERQRLGLDEEQVRSLHAKVFRGAISYLSDDRRIGTGAEVKLRLLYQALAKLGWAPGM